ncbi:MAG: hypothetical protein AVDCRST_MAG57-3514 [uncultured Blastococcus sp.]|uniref:Uncharacterized protein n=1 Tax=uncultured Blastococcus sp. TaxID=217144 RepID=A0A6J4JDW2_9ACTN|nr:MAG: hypothetical protein AVDCRST_MAG57-3514 [uncultured Blastococcus sp.]
MASRRCSASSPLRPGGARRRRGRRSPRCRPPARPAGGGSPHGSPPSAPWHPGPRDRRPAAHLA